MLNEMIEKFLKHGKRDDAIIVVTDDGRTEDF